MRIAVCSPQVPFERGGAEIFADDLVGELRARGITSRGRVTLDSRTLAPTNGYYVVSVPPGSAALLIR